MPPRRTSKDTSRRVFPSEISKEIRDCSKAFLRLLQKRKTRSSVVLFWGNGISSGEEDTLSVKKLVSSFVRNSADKNPRRFEVKRESINRIRKTFESSTEQTHDMTQFMKDVSELGEFRDDLRSYVIQQCCTARPASNHYLLLAFASCLSQLRGARPNVLGVTTNYDNLVERAYLRREPSDLAALLARRAGIPPPFMLRYRLALMRRTALLHGTEQDFSNKWILRPKYTLTRSSRTRSVLPIVPLHGSVRVCKCPRCNKELETEAAALREKRCVYCGQEIPQVVVPTTEGEIDKELLGILESAVNEASVIIFVGYGFDDPHIRERLRLGLTSSSYPKNKIVINVCRAKLRTEDIQPMRKENIFEINTKDVGDALRELILSFDGKVRAKTQSFFNQLKEVARYAER